MISNILINIRAIELVLVSIFSEFNSVTIPAKNFKKCHVTFRRDWKNEGQPFFMLDFIYQVLDMLER